MSFFLFSHGLHQHQQIPGVGAVGNHATITSQTSMNSYTGSSKFHIPGKQLSLRLKKAQIDKAHKDKTNKTFPDNFSVTLFLVKPPEDQSDHLIDYSLLPQSMMASSMNNHSTISTGKYIHIFFREIAKKNNSCCNITKFPQKNIFML